MATKIVKGLLLGEDQIEFEPANNTVSNDKLTDDVKTLLNKASDLDNLATKTELNNKIDAQINDANYFTSLPNGNYIATGVNESNSPNDGSGVHLYVTSIRNNWFTQTCFSHETGRIFTRSGNLEYLDGTTWEELVRYNNFISTTIVITPDSNGVYQWQHNKGIKYNNISLTLQSSNYLGAYLWDESNENVAKFLFQDMLGNPINHEIRVGLFALS